MGIKSINRVALLGFLTSDPQIETTQTGKRVMRLSIATNYDLKKGDSWQEKVDFHRVNLWRNIEYLSSRLRKGSQVYIEGKLSTHSYEDNTGKKVYRVNITASTLIPLRNTEEKEANREYYEDTSPDLPIDEDEVPY
jgi:single-strand DNA-binding protein